MAFPEFQGAFEHCSWCQGRGCNQCRYERSKWIEANEGPDGLPQPIFEADPSNPEDMRLLRHVVGREALEQAFGPGGGGVREIEKRAAMARVLQIVRKLRPAAESDVGGNENEKAGGA